jgi:Zn-dependent membrane protease YugP
MIRENNLLTETEMRGAKQVLDAAALTYVAAAASALLTLLYFVLRLTGVRRDD